MITFHLMFELHYKTTFYDKNTIKKHVTPQNHFATAKFKKLTRKKRSGIIYLTEVVIFATADESQLNLVFIADSCTGFRSGLF